MVSKKKKHRKKASGIPSNADLEMRWVDAWNEMYEIIGHRNDTKCRLPDGTVVSVEECQGWLQQSALAGFRVRVESGSVMGGQGVVAFRWRE
jgi:hypothetical protein